MAGSRVNYSPFARRTQVTALAVSVFLFSLSFASLLHLSCVIVFADWLEQSKMEHESEENGLCGE